MGVTEADVITGSRGTGSERGPALGYLVARDCPDPGSEQPRASGQDSLKPPTSLFGLVQVGEPMVRVRPCREEDGVCTEPSQRGGFAGVSHSHRDRLSFLILVVSSLLTVYA